MTYVADENGYQPKSSVLPTTPPMPLHSKAQAIHAQFLNFHNYHYDKKNAWVHENGDEISENIAKELYDNISKLLKDGYEYDPKNGFFYVPQS